ncbi:uncharacterized protein LOC110057638 isoform X2 [Orbicella faveolata]|uniref:uncharacterized protein LOC110057638 isoform X2 n=1 Tax=Orbicella faveolata TaxID=48498 RepID=UPI0009E23646|nr:uncharacterized protein LOC110057638 isoform X2 [Orbicella faveolata]
MQCLKGCWALPKPCTMRSVSSHEGTCRSNTRVFLTQHIFFCVTFDQVQLDNPRSVYSLPEDSDGFDVDADEEDTEIRIVKRVEDYYPENKFTARYQMCQRS